MIKKYGVAVLFRKESRYRKGLPGNFTVASVSLILTDVFLKLSREKRRLSTSTNEKLKAVKGFGSLIKF